MGPAVVEQNLFFLRQGAELLRRLDDELYTRPLEDRPRAAGVGSHLRHCLDFYRSFLRDLASGRIDYDRRERDRAIETERAAGLAVVEELVREFEAVGELEAERPLKIRHDIAPDEDTPSSWHGSSVGRELRFLCSHTVHHYAIIAQIVRSHGFDPGEHFGVAPATLAHWRAAAKIAH